MPGWNDFWFPLAIILVILPKRPVRRILQQMLTDAALDDRKTSAAVGHPTVSGYVIIQDKRTKSDFFDDLYYYIDFWDPSQNKVITCEVSKQLFDALQQGQGGILTYQGSAFRSFLRNGEIFYDKC